MPGRVAHGTYSHDLGRRHPFEVAMLFAAAVVGFSRVLAPTSGALERALPMWLALAFYLLLSFGSVTALVGVFWREPTGGLLTERAGLLVLGSACVFFGGTVLTVAGLQGVASATFVFGFAAAALIRAFDIGRIVSRIHALALAQEAVLNEGD